MKSKISSIENLLSVICYLLPEEGQSMLEVLIALTLVTVFLSGMVLLQLYSIKNVSLSEKRSSATKLARQQLDRVKVVRDSTDIHQLDTCLSSCFINKDLTPVPLTPTGIFDQVVKVEVASPTECPLPSVAITTPPVSYKVTVKVTVKETTSLTTPTPIAQLSSCITDWR